MIISLYLDLKIHIIIIQFKNRVLYLSNNKIVKKFSLVFIIWNRKISSIKDNY